MLACKFTASKDKTGKKTKIVHMLSTCNQPNPVPIGKIDKHGNAIEKFTYIRERSLHMGGVDRVDQQLYGRVGQQLYGISPLQKSNKWYKKLAF